MDEKSERRNHGDVSEGRDLSGLCHLNGELKTRALGGGSEGEDKDSKCFSQPSLVLQP